MSYYDRQSVRIPFYLKELHIYGIHLSLFTYDASIHRISCWVSGLSFPARFFTACWGFDDPSLPHILRFHAPDTTQYPYLMLNTLANEFQSRFWTISLSRRPIQAVTDQYHRFCSFFNWPSASHDYFYRTRSHWACYNSATTLSLQFRTASSSSRPPMPQIQRIMLLLPIIRLITTLGSRLWKA